MPGCAFQDDPTLGSSRKGDVETSVPGRCRMLQNIGIVPSHDLVTHSPFGAGPKVRLSIPIVYSAPRTTSVWGISSVFDNLAQWDVLHERDARGAVGASCLAGLLKNLKERLNDVDRHGKDYGGILFGADLGQRLQVS